MGLDRTLPCREFLYRQPIAAASLLNIDGAAVHSVDDYGLAPGDPALGVRGRQVAAITTKARQEIASEGERVPAVSKSIVGAGNGFKKI